MNAPERLPHPPVSSRVQSSPRRPSRRRPSSQPRRRGGELSWPVVMETGLKLAVDLTVSVGAIAALTHLVPSYNTSRVQLEQLHQEVDQTRSQVQLLQGKFSRYFDPTQVNPLIEEETQRLDPQRQPIVWTQPSPDETSR